MEISMLAKVCANSAGSMDQKLWSIKSQPVEKNIQPIEKNSTDWEKYSIDWARTLAYFSDLNWLRENIQSVKKKQWALKLNVQSVGLNPQLVQLGNNELVLFLGFDFKSVLGF